jgi:predicted DNA-binding transcriptional regulator AlpA
MSIELIYTFEHLLEMTGMTEDAMMQIIHQDSFPVALVQFDEVVGWRSSEIMSWFEDHREMLS